MNNFKVRAKTILYDLAVGTAHGGSTPSFTGSDAVLVKENIAVTTYTVPDSPPLDEIGLGNSSDKYFKELYDELYQTRPTAVNLRWALNSCFKEIKKDFITA